jgi:8-oxo-dGDP phosphatase
MTLDAPRLGAADLHDLQGRRPVLASEVSYRGRVWDVRTDRVDLGDGGVAVRDFVEHPGAVVILAVREDRGGPEVLVIRQYRHPIGAEDWELPAGLLDVDGEPPLEAARRELLEEADLRAEEWEELLSFTPSPGSLAERITMFLATGVSDVPEDDRHEREHEEVGMPVGWVPLDDAVAAVLAGQLHNGPLMLGVLALHARRR